MWHGGFDYPNFGGHNFYDENLVSNGNVYEGTAADKRPHARGYSFGALLFIDRIKASDPGAGEQFDFESRPH